MVSHAFGRKRRLAALTVVAVIALVGCGDDDDDTTAAAESPSEAPAEGGAETYKLMVMTGLTQGSLPIPPFPEGLSGAEAAAAEINAAGGVNGHDIEIVPCDTKWDSNAAVECARKAADEGILAIIGGSDTTGDYYDVLEAEGVPSIAPYVLFRELTSPMSYPIMGGVPALNAGMFSQLAHEGILDVASLFNGDAAAGSENAKSYAPVIENFDGMEVTQIPIAEGATDLSAAIAAAARHNGVAALVPPVQMIPMINALRQGGSDVQFVANSTGLDAASIQELGEKAEGLMVTSLFVPPTVNENDGVAAFVEAMEAHDPEAKLNDTSQNTYLGVKTFAAAVEGLDEVTPETVVEALDNMAEQDFGMLAPFSFAEADAAVPEFPRMFNPNVVYAVVKGGKVVPSSDQFNNAYTGKPVG